MTTEGLYARLLAIQAEWERAAPSGEPNPDCPGDCGLCAMGYTCGDRRTRDNPPGQETP